MHSAIIDPLRPIARRLYRFGRAVGVGMAILVASLVVSMPLDNLLVGSVMTSEEYGLFFAAWMVVTIGLVVAYGRAQLD